MRLIEYYVRLLLTFPEMQVHVQTNVTRTTLSRELDCTERNVIYILNKLEDKNWIKVKRGKGRGHTTAITFLKTIEEMFAIYEKQSPRTEDIERLVTILETKNTDQRFIHLLMQMLFGARTPQVEGGEYESLKIPYFRSIYSLDPAQAERQTERHLVRQIFNTLVTYNEKSKEIEASLSHYWEVDDDGKQFTFHLRKGIMFHHSKRLEAKDVQFTFERLKVTSANWIVQDLDSITCMGKHRIQFTFRKPSYHWISLLTSSKCSIVPFAYGNKPKDAFAKRPIGTGPYKIKEHETNFMKLSVHQDYFQERAHMDEIDLFILPSLEKYLHASDIVEESNLYIPFTTSSHIGDRFNYVERTRLSVKYLMWNIKKERIRTNEALRRTLSMIVDKERMVNELGYPRYQPASSFMKNSPPDQYLDRDVVREEINDPLLVITYDLEPHKKDVDWIKKTCEYHGIPLKIKILPYADFWNDIERADLVLFEYVTEESEEVSLFHLFRTGTGLINNLLDSDRKANLQQIIQTAYLQEEEQERLKVLEKADQLLCGQAFTIPLYWTFQKALYHKNIIGTTLNTLGLVPFKNLFYKK
ncbi:ABC transporter substrate-binding protein [Aquibacillus koreensis]|uniref:ABC transporter substrate-binding protein n=1 Tax=Aquibacillus koreensis TaxID=279446 RepID=A0A9X3WPC7_9BACI|nr:ABC transporter substrate-binding protein [Aquibacillus koreensis]MCT2535448.1 ABC transporter substrate-binding protein [Aquibacillus koreensis]MDC3422283.1 ABC transporter substrate-binding protein [Aquibacillus koreensis]